MNNTITGGFVHRLKRLLPLAVLIFAACDDPFGPAIWSAVPDTVQIYSASRPEFIGLPSTVDITLTPVGLLPIESPAITGNWDFALADNAGGLAIVPAAAFAGLQSRARVGYVDDQTFDELTVAPRDTAEFSAVPVQLQTGGVYVVRSRRASCGGVSSGYRYAKLRAIDVDVAAGTFRFEIVRNPYCDDRSFVPPEE